MREWRIRWIRVSRNWSLPPSMGLSVDSVHGGASASRRTVDEGWPNSWTPRARALEAGTEFLGVGVCREAWLLVALDKQRVVEHLLLGRATAVGAELLLVTPVDRALDVNPARVEQPEAPAKRVGLIEPGWPAVSMSCRISAAAPSSGIRTAACRRGCRQLRGSRRSCSVVFSLRQRGEPP